jgi:hypothetical protein
MDELRWMDEWLDALNNDKIAIVNKLRSIAHFQFYNWQFN